MDTVEEVLTKSMNMMIAVEKNVSIVGLVPMDTVEGVQIKFTGMAILVSVGIVVLPQQDTVIEVLIKDMKNRVF